MRKNKRSIRDLVKEANRAYSDLNMFYAVIALMDSSLVSSDCQSTESRIVTICKAEAQKCLQRYDKALAAIEQRTSSPQGGVMPAYDYIKRTYGVEPKIGERVQHTVTKRFGKITREKPSAAHYVNVMFDGLGFSQPCHPTELDYSARTQPEKR